MKVNTKYMLMLYLTSINITNTGFFVAIDKCVLINFLNNWVYRVTVVVSSMEYKVPVFTHLFLLKTEQTFFLACGNEPVRLGKQNKKETYWKWTESIASPALFMHTVNLYQVPVELFSIDFQECHSMATTVLLHAFLSLFSKFFILIPCFLSFFFF